MKVLIVVAHPDRNSIELKNIVPTINMSYKKKGYDVTIINLYNDDYNPSQFIGDISNINNNAFAKSYRHLIKTSNHIWIISPSRWLSLNPLIEGFIDQVFIKGFAYRDNMRLLGEKKLGVIVTSNLPKRFKLKTLNILWIRLRLMVFPKMFKYMNIRVHQLWNVNNLKNLEKNKMLHNIKNIVNKFIEKK